MTIEGIDPNQITVTPGGAILYKGEDIRAKLSGKTPASLGVNLSCINSSHCTAVNIQCENLGRSENCVNVGLCRSA